MLKTSKLFCFQNGVRDGENQIIGYSLWSLSFQRVYGSTDWSNAREEEGSAVYSLTEGESINRTHQELARFPK